MPSTSTQDWFYNVPSKRSDAPAKDAPAPSQIPGLSNMPDDQVMNDDRTARRKWIRDTDSKYVKLAKAGGRRDLLKYRDPPSVNTEAKPYPRVDWFDHPNSANHDENELNKTPRDCRVLPDWYVHDEDHHVDDPEVAKRVSSKIAGLPSKSGPDEKNRKQILSFDTMSYWEREKMDDKKDQKLPSIKRSKAKLSKTHSQLSTQQNSQSNTQINKSIKLPQIQEAVVFSKLMSMDYQRQWLDNQRTDRDKERAQRKETEAEKRSKMEMITQPQRKYKSKESQEEKPLFKMSKFSNIPAKVNSGRTQ